MAWDSSPLVQFQIPSGKQAAVCVRFPGAGISPAPFPPSLCKLGVSVLIPAARGKITASETITASEGAYTVVRVGWEGNRGEKRGSTNDFPVLFLGLKVDLHIPISPVAFWSPFRTLNMLKAEK